MWGILLSAVNYFIGFAFRAFIIKFAIMFGLFFAISELVPVLQNAGLLPTVASLNSVFGSFSEATWYFADLLAINYGAPLIISALVSKFIIRRIPFLN